MTTDQISAVQDALKALRAEIEPMARQIICPKDNTFTRQLALINSIQDIVKDGGWISVAKSLPDDDTTVLIGNRDWVGDPVTGGWLDGNVWYEDGGAHLDDDMAPTHWMPLPELPESKEAQA